jgi:hypothetical protein
MKLTSLKWSLLVATAFSLYACDKNENEEPNDEEVITTVRMIYTIPGTTTAITASWEDLDGPGGNNPVIDTIKLQANRTYNAAVLVLDRSKTPVDTVSYEILEEDYEHRFYYNIFSGANINVTNLNKDRNGVTLGTTSTWTTLGAATGNARVTLRHYDEGGKAEADPVDSPKSSSDIECTFPTRVF